MKCRIAVRMATGGVFDDEAIDDFLRTLEQRALRKGLEKPTLSQREAVAEAAGELTHDQLMAALTARRMRVAVEIARTGRQAQLAAMPDSLDEGEKLRALNVGSERQGRGVSNSTDALGRAEAITAWGQVQRGLEAMPGLVNRISDFWGNSEKEVDRKIAREMARLNGNGSIEPTGDEGAFHAAQVFAKALDEVRQGQNAQGAWISKLEGYIARQSHDRLKVAGGFWRELAEIGRRAPAEKLAALDWKAARLGAAKRAFREWRDFIRPKLDPKTFEGLTDRDFEGEDPHLADAHGLAERGVIDDPGSLEERMLYRVWSDIVTGRREQLSGADDTSEFRAPPSKAAAVSRERVLHFKDPDAWVDYNNRFGTGSLYRSVMMQLERGSRNTALMARWGPNPEAAFENEIARLETTAKGRGDVDAANALHGWKVKASFEAINGRLEVPESLRMAMVVRSLRSWEAITKLGSIVLSKATDLPMTGHTFARAGAGFLSGYEAAFKGLAHMQGEEGKRAADLLDVGARSFAGHLSGQFNAADGLAGWNAWAARIMYRINLFEFVNEGVRRGSAEVFSRFLGQEAEHDWTGLQQGTRETFERFGISEADWETVRHGLTPASDGRTYFTLDHLEGRVPDEAARRELAMRFRTMIHDTIDNTTSEPRMRERIGLIGSGGLRAGTIWGEFARSFGQFRGFLQTILGRHLAPATQGYAGYAPAALMAHFIVASALAGWFSMNAKLISRGEAPRSFVGADAAETAKIWGAAMAQGGGLGIYGDYLFGEQNRNGLEFTLSSVGGPAIGDMEQILQVIRQATHGGAISPTTGKSQIPGELVRIGSHNIPLINLWYTRLALDYFVLWRMQEAVSPGYLRRYEDRVKNQQGSDFILNPTSAQ